MKSNDMSRRFRTKIVTNIFYSAVITCLIEVFLIANVSMIVSYLKETRYADSFLLQMTEINTLMVLIYVILGIAVFTVTFLTLLEKALRYIGKISSAIQNISEGDLNTTVEVIGDDEFTQMAVNLNKMMEDIRRLMDKEREAERTKNELITNVAHDLRTPLTSIIGYLELLSGKVQIPQEMQKKYIDIAFADLNDYLEYGREEVPVIIKNPDTGEDEVLKRTVNMVKFKESAFADGTILSEVKQGRNGASIKLADRMKALDWLSKHMNITTEEQKLKIEVLKKQLNTNDQEDDGVEIINDAPI